MCFSVVVLFPRICSTFRTSNTPALSITRRRESPKILKLFVESFSTLFILALPCVCSTSAGLSTATSPRTVAACQVAGTYVAGYVRNTFIPRDTQHHNWMITTTHANSSHTRDSYINPPILSQETSKSLSPSKQRRRSIAFKTVLPFVCDIFLVKINSSCHLLTLKHNRQQHPANSTRSINYHAKARARAHTYTYIHIYIYTHTHTHTYTHIYIHT
jgi:hypothetical protein